MNTQIDERVPWALVVDDDGLSREMVCFALEREGFVCEVATGHESAQASLHAGQFDMLVIDASLLTEFGGTKGLGISDTQSRPVIVAHSSLAEAQRTNIILSQDVDDVVFKPANYSHLARKAKALTAYSWRQPAEQ